MHDEVGNVIDRGQLVTVALLTEGVLLLLAAIFIQLFGLPSNPPPNTPNTIFIFAVLGGTAIAASGFLMLFLASILRDVSWLNRLKQIVLEELLPLFRPLNFLDILMIAAASGFCEEVFFRGIVQCQLAIWMGGCCFPGFPKDELAVLASSLLFAALHCPGRRYLPYGLWALGVLGVFGWWLMATHSLLAPIVAHALSNFIVLLILRYKFSSSSPA